MGNHLTSDLNSGGGVRPYMAARAARAAIRASQILGALLVTLTAAAGCNKAKALTHDATHAPPATKPDVALRLKILDSATAPRMLFEVFGDRSDPRMVPIALIDGNVLRALDLSPADWLRFDRRYNRPGSTYTLYQDGHAVGTAAVKRGMWQNPTRPLVTLPHCRHLLPLSAVMIDPHAPLGITAEFLASNVPLSASGSGTDLAAPVAVDVARRLAEQAGKSAQIPRSRLDSLDFHASAVHTGATTSPTIIASFIDPAASGNADGGGTSTYVFVIADQTAIGYAPTYQLAVNGPVAGATFRRYIDHLDLDGGGVDNIILETWTYGGSSYLTVLKWGHGRWNEVFRGNSSWCLDEPSGGR
jgi:hypothetical protein